MKRIAIYPGSFDPVTLGHVDVIKRAVRLFDEVIVAVAESRQKTPALSVEERVSLIKRAVKKVSRVRVESFNGLLVEYLKKKKAQAIIRGLRAISDFEYEFQMALMNRKLYPDAETVFLMPAEPYTYLSSSLVKEIVRLGGKVNCLVPDKVQAALNRKFRKKS